MKIKKISILAILLLSIFTGCDKKENIDEDVVATKQQKQKKPVFSLMTNDLNPLKISVKEDGWNFEGYENKTILLNFFGTWCPPCKAEIPHLLNIQKRLKKEFKHKKESPFEIIAVDVGKRDGSINTKEEIEEFIKKFKITYPILRGENNRALFGALQELNRSGSIPFMILFNKKGQFIEYYVGMKPEEMLFNDILQTIKMK